MSWKPCKPAPRPVGFTDRSHGLAGKHAHEQGWRIIEVQRTIGPRPKRDVGVGKSQTLAELIRQNSPAGTGSASVYSATQKSEQVPGTKTLSRPTVLWARSKPQKNAA